MRRKLQGRYQTITTESEQVKAFIPASLPPRPALQLTNDLQSKIERAMLALGELRAAPTYWADANSILYTYIRKEAVLSSMIEGTQSSLSDLLQYEMDQAPGVPLGDVEEVSNYVAALNHGLRRIEEDDFPISLRLICEMHEFLLRSGRGNKATPGEFRRSQNWIGGTRPGNAVFVPPPADQVVPCLGELEKFIHAEGGKTPVLIKAALVHLQFETIHPFLDGNGRLGRLLITLILCTEGVLEKPMLYLSLFFKIHRSRYYELLNIVRMEGDWEAWLEFFVEAVDTTARQAIETVERLHERCVRDHNNIIGIGRAEESCLAVQRRMLERPIVTSGWLVEQIGLTPATINRALERLCDLGIVEEITGRKRNRLFSYSKYIQILNKGLEPL